ncbi:signal recognition particle-docking protein FtsY [Candidatus Woesearchaeota archaeon]|nr:signal recognition particle-docking protein FtsY [Candidatus Woesearchaeota archaeon]
MFKFLKEKLKQAAAKFSKQVKETVETPEEEKPKKKKAAKPKAVKKIEKPVKKEGTVFEAIKEKFEKPKEAKKPEIKKAIKPKIKKPKVEEIKPKPEIKKEEPKPKVIEEKPEIKPEVKEEPKFEEVKIEPEKEEKPRGILGKLKEKITKTTISEDRFNDMFWDLELALLENNVAVEVIEKIKQDLAGKLVNVPVQRRGLDDLIQSSLMESINDLFDVEKIDVIEKAKQKKPFVIAFVGVNGVGKTTTIAKMAKLFEKHKMKCVMAAADTFRTAAIEQLEEHANKLGVKCIKHEYGSDSAAVAFDAIKHAQATNKDIVLIDTAGRTHVNKNLMDELKKVIRVSKPDLIVFVGDALTGNDAVEQAKEFNDAVGIDGIILAKSDVDEKGGAAVSVSYVTKKPILYLGMGQKYEDLKEFTPNLIFENLKFESAEVGKEEE